MIPQALLPFGVVEALLLPFGLILTRLGALVAACPPFLPETTPRSLKVGFVVMLTLALTWGRSFDAHADSWLLAFAWEAWTGAVMGTVVRLGAVAVSYAGELFDLHVGFGFAHQLNPLSLETAGPLTTLAHMVGGLLFFACGGQRLLIAALGESLRYAPPGGGAMTVSWAQFLSLEVGASFVSGVRMAMPIMALMLAVQLALALVARVAPQLNIWAVGFLATTGASLWALWLYMPAWSADIVRTWEEQTQALAQLWKS